MPIELTNETEYERLPVLKINEVGDSITGRIVDANDVQMRSFETGDLETWDNGDPKMQKVVTMLVDTWAGQAHGRADSEDVPLEAGMLGTVFCGVAGTYALREGLKDAGCKLVVGGIATWTLDRTEKAKTKGFNDRKIRTWAFEPNPSAASIAEAEEAHHARKAAPAIDLDNNNEDPF